MATKIELGPSHTDVMVMDALRRKNGERKAVIAMGQRGELASRITEALRHDTEPTGFSLPAIRAIVTSSDFPGDEVLEYSGVSTFLSHLDREGARKLIVYSERIAFGNIRTHAELANMFSHNEIPSDRFEALLTEDSASYQGVVQLVRKGLQHAAFQEGFQMYLDGNTSLPEKEAEQLLSGREVMQPKNTAVLRNVLESLRPVKPMVTSGLVARGLRNPQRRQASYGIYGDPGR